MRVMRACRDLGLASVVVYSEADRNSLPVRMADEAICIGPGPSSKSYLSIPNIISAAVISGCDAVHPGYGFLAEDRYFAEICQQYKLKFIGPTPEAIAQTGDKAAARRFMQEAGIPVLPGTENPVGSLDEALLAAARVGYPVMLKPSLGGGGRGMRLVQDRQALTGGFNLARSEARASFDSDDLYLERYLQRCRHIEVQVLGDTQGNVIQLGERECSIQRRHQKLIEEAPAGCLDEDTRKHLGEIAVRGAQALGYVSAGTLEFLVDDEGSTYFIEMNSRIQVEHGVTELVTGVDIVKEQIRVAAGEPLSAEALNAKVRGHAIECRINAERGRDFQPVTGTIRELVLPGGPGIRVDSHIYAGYSVPAHYDSLLGKIMAYGSTRAEAIARMRRALQETLITGVESTLPYIRSVLADEEFQAGHTYTDYVPSDAS